jgi:hypothetical protein
MTHVIIQGLTNRMKAHDRAVLASPRQVCHNACDGFDVISASEFWGHFFEEDLPSRYSEQRRPNLVSIVHPYALDSFLFDLVLTTVIGDHPAVHVPALVKFIVEIGLVAAEDHLAFCPVQRFAEFDVLLLGHLYRVYVLTAAGLLEVGWVDVPEGIGRIEALEEIPNVHAVDVDALESFSDLGQFCLESFPGIQVAWLPATFALAP